MSANNGVIRIGRKGLKKFAFGEDGQPFEVDVVVAFQRWVMIDESFRENSDDRTIKTEDIMAYHQEAVKFAEDLAGQANFEQQVLRQEPDPPIHITTAEALDFIARLREQYDELAVFFRPKSREEPDSPDSSGVELRFSEEAS